MGSYTITYTATDPSGNSASAIRSVYVADTTPPVVALIGPANLTNECHTAFVDPGATADDACTGPLPVTTNGTVSANALGSYTITYSATDPSGNSNSVSRTVYVVDTTPPVLALIRPASLTNECHTAFVDPGATADDACAGPLPVTTNDTVNANAVGSYTITYSATDPSGNSNSVSRTVYVMDTTPPVIACSSNITVYTTNASGVAVTFTTTATDLCSASPTVVCTPASGSTFVVGTTTVQCVATDDSSNSTNCSFTVTVSFNNPPTTSPIALGALENHPSSVEFDKLLFYDADIDNGEVLTITGVSASSTNGGLVTLTSTNVISSPATNFVGADLFTYMVSDGFGGIATGSVLVQVFAGNGSSLNLIGGITITQAGAQMRFAVIPGQAYTVERSTDGINWTPVQAVTGPANGILDFLDPSVTSGTVYYRTAGS